MVRAFVHTTLTVSPKIVASQITYSFLRCFPSSSIGAMHRWQVLGNARPWHVATLLFPSLRTPVANAHVHVIFLRFREFDTKQNWCVFKEHVFQLFILNFLIFGSSFFNCKNKTDLLTFLFHFCLLFYIKICSKETERTNYFRLKLSSRHNQCK